MKGLGSLALAIIMFLLAGCEGRKADTMKQHVDVVEPDVSDAARQCWAAIQNAAPRSQVEASQADVWINALLEVHKALWNLEGGGEGSKLRYIIDQFGKHGPKLDFLLLFGDPFLTMPMTLGPEKPLLLTREANGISWKEFQAVREKVCRCQVERFLNDPVALRRYCDAVLWWARMVRTNDMGTLFRAADNVHDGFGSSDASETYWWLSRKFLVLACLTEHLDVLKKADAMDLRPAFSEWYSWLQSGRQFKFDATIRSWISYPDWMPLRNDDNAPWPKKPFGDWDDLPPPRLGVILGYTEKIIEY